MLGPEVGFAGGAAAGRCEVGLLDLADPDAGVFAGQLEADAVAARDGRVVGVTLPPVSRLRFLPGKVAR